jgi:HSP20 family molecular chaperone IbpA
MAFVLTPRFAPAYQAQQCNPFGLCAPVSRSPYAYRVARPRPQRPQYSSFNHFFSQVDELLSEIDREAQRQAQIKAIEAQREAQHQAHRQRQQRKRALRANFAVSQIEQGWQVDGEIQGFDQENISIEVTDEHTLKVSGNTQWQAEKKVQSEQQQQTEVEAAQSEPTEQTAEEKMDGVTLNEPDYENVTDAETATTERAATPDSDTQSHKSYQATVEDDFEDLGAETSSLISSPSRPSSPTEVKEPKGKEKAVEEPTATQTTVVTQPLPEAPVQQQQAQQQEEHVHGSFERTFRFPERVDATNVSASFKDGALRIIVPRAQVQQIRRIAIL